MKTKRMISLLLAVVLTLSVAVTPAFAASAGSELAAGKAQTSKKPTMSFPSV